MAVPAFAQEKMDKKEKPEKGEKHLKRSALPAAVQKTADEQSKGSTVKGYATEMENGMRVYEVELNAGGHTKDVTIAEDGTVLAIEEQVNFDKLPAAVADALKKKAGSGSITKVESITKNGNLVAYEAVVKTGKKTAEIQVGPDGQDLPKKE
jgi:uncharacterized membrane protein YkoI